MQPLRPGTILPTDEEDAAINAGIAADPDTYELTEEFFAQARPASEILPPELYRALTAQNKARHAPAA